MSITWCPPPAITGKRKWTAEAAELRTRPGQWAVIDTKTAQHAADSMAYAINIAQLKAFQPAGDYEACARGKSVYVRYLGDGELPVETEEASQCPISAQPRKRQ